MDAKPPTKTTGRASTTAGGGASGPRAWASRSTVTCVTTDGGRMAVARDAKAIAGGCKLAKKHAIVALVPANTIAVIEKIAGAEDVEVEIGVDRAGGRITFTTPEAEITSNPVDGKFPPYEEVIPKEFGTKLTVARVELLTAVKRAGLLADTAEGHRGVRFTLGRKGLTLTSRSPESGESTVNLPCRVEGPGLEIGFNPDLVGEGLRYAAGLTEADEVAIELTAPNRPAVVRAGADGEFTYVVMPVNITATAAADKPSERAGIPVEQKPETAKKGEGKKAVAEEAAAA